MTHFRSHRLFVSLVIVANRASFEWITELDLHPQSMGCGATGAANLCTSREARPVRRPCSPRPRPPKEKPA
jgi:hypothetical protein